jgi:hypothetical protein
VKKLTVDDRQQDVILRRATGADANILHPACFGLSSMKKAKLSGDRNRDIERDCR